MQKKCGFRRSEVAATAVPRRSAARRRGQFSGLMPARATNSFTPCDLCGNTRGHLLGSAGDDLEAGLARGLERLRPLHRRLASFTSSAMISGGVPAGANSALKVSETKPG